MLARVVETVPDVEVMSPVKAGICAAPKVPLVMLEATTAAQVRLPFTAMAVAKVAALQSVGLAAKAVAVAALPVVLWLNVGNVLVPLVRFLLVTVCVLIVVRTVVATIPESEIAFVPLPTGRLPVVSEVDVVLPPPPPPVPHTAPVVWRIPPTPVWTHSPDVRPVAVREGAVKAPVKVLAAVSCGTQAVLMSNTGTPFAPIQDKQFDPPAIDNQGDHVFTADRKY